MASESSPPTSFSARRRWGIFFSVVISTVAVFGVIIMLNYLGARYYARFMWSNQGGVQLSLRTVALLKSITNEVKVTVYYDKKDNLYSSVSTLLDEFRLTNPKISVQTVDYLVDAAAAQQIKATNKLNSAEEKNLVIFNCNGRRNIVYASQLADYDYPPDPNGKQFNYERHLKAFEGEKCFSSALLSVLSTKPRLAYFLEGHGEHPLAGQNSDGYQKFETVLGENNIQPMVLRLFGTNTIPADCNLLIIAGPRKPIPHDELEKIRLYLDQGGRLFVLFHYDTRSFATGLEPILANFNVNVGTNVINDPANTRSDGAILIGGFNQSHMLVNPLVGSSLAMVQPRSITVLHMGKQGPETPKVDALAFTGEKSTLGDSSTPVGGSVPVMVAVEKGSIKGVFAERGTMAMVVAGDSAFLDNQMIDASDNRDFASFAVNWLLDQTQLLQGVGPHPIKEYKLVMTNSQMANIRWLFLGAMPGAIMLFGGLVWFRRRH